MPLVTIVIREPGSLSPDYSLDFDLPAIPTEGSFISIVREGEQEPYSEDLLVKAVWWRLSHPTSDAVSTHREIGKVSEIFVECDTAQGPHASTQWLKTVDAARQRGAEVVTFPIYRYSIPQKDLPPTGT